MPGLPSNVTCASIAEMYPRVSVWPHGYGSFDPFRHCEGADPELLSVICTLRCAVNPQVPSRRHAEIFCSYEFDKQHKYGMRARHLHIDLCEMASVCVSPTTEESQLTCSIGVNTPKSSSTLWLQVEHIPPLPYLLNSHLKINSLINCLHPGSRSLDPGTCIPDPGSRTLDPGPWIQNPGSGVLDPGTWIQGPGFLDPGSWIQCPGSSVLDPCVLIPGSGIFWVQDLGSRVRILQGLRSRVLDAGSRIQGPGCRALGPGCRIPDPGS